MSTTMCNQIYMAKGGLEDIPHHSQQHNSHLRLDVLHALSSVLHWMTLNWWTRHLWVLGCHQFTLAKKEKQACPGRCKTKHTCNKTEWLKVGKKKVGNVLQTRCINFSNFDLGKLRLLKRLIFRSICLNSARIATWSMALAWPLQRKIPSMNSCARTNNRSTHSATLFYDNPL